MKKDEAIESIIKNIKEFDADDQNQILFAVTTAVVEQRKEVIESKSAQLKDLVLSLENIPVLLKV
jgi:hypothetical protein